VALVQRDEVAFLPVRNSHCACPALDDVLDVFLEEIAASNKILRRGPQLRDVTTKASKYTKKIQFFVLFASSW